MHNLWFMRLRFSKDVACCSGETAWAAGHSHWVEYGDLSCGLGQVMPRGLSSRPFSETTHPPVGGFMHDFIAPTEGVVVHNVKEGPCLSTPTSGPELRPRPCGGPCALEKCHRRTQQ